MKKAYLKDIGREIKKTRKRYISIIAIVILGVAFYVGINTASPDMLNTFNKYINNCNMFDLNLISTVGFDDNDLEKIRNIEKIDYIEPTKSMNVVVEKDNKERVINVKSLPNEITDNTINKLEVVKGEYPTKNNEIILDNRLSGEYKLKDTIELIESESNNIDEIFKIKSYIVVGFANSPLFISTSRGTTTLVDGTVSGFAGVLEDAFSIKEYTNVYAKVETNNKNRTSDEYINEIEKIQEKVKEKIDNIEIDKYNDLYDKAKQKIEDGKIEIQNGRDKLVNAEKEISNAKVDLKNAEKELVKQKQNYNIQIKDADDKLEYAKNTISNAKIVLDEKQKELNKGLDDLTIEEEKLIVEEKNILNGTNINDLNTYLEYLKVNSAPEQIIANIQNLINVKREIENQKKSIQDYQSELDLGVEEYNKGLEELKIQEEELNDKKNKAQYEFKEAENKINNGWKELENNQKKFEEEKLNSLKKIEDAEKEITNAEEQLNDLKVKIYVLNLETNEGYVSYKSDSHSVATIGKVFPVIFFLVAALVSLTAMTRMVEENRGIIGTYKSLGYSRYKIALKYLIYSVTATLIGIILGTVIGSYTLPWVIAEAYKILYNTLPTVIMTINIKYALTAGVAALASTTISTLFACYRALKATPAKLMRPKSPKEGKKIFLEKIPFIWKHFTFIQKITARNVFRYKKRLLMTVIGISGCTALIFMGFGLRNSIREIVSKQYNEIRKYDFELTLKNKLTKEQENSINTYIEECGYNTKYTYLRQQTNDIKVNNEEQNAYIIGVNNQEELKDFVKIKNRKTKEEVNIKDDGVIITEKLAKLLNINENDEILIKIDDETYKNVKVIGIAENYIYHYIYMNKSEYEKIFNEEMIDNQIYLEVEETLDKEKEEEISKYLLLNENIAHVSRISSISESFGDMIKSLDIIVIVLITCAGMLAFVVLYNLNSINIEERKRELATIKLLGFYNKEVSSYVFRENIVLTIIGDILGLVLGVYLLNFIISTAEMDIVMFGRDKAISSYIFAFLMTIIFALLINLIMNKDLKKINMIESLKSVE